MDVRRGEFLVDGAHVSVLVEWLVTGADIGLVVRDVDVFETWECYVLAFAVEYQVEFVCFIVRL